MYCRNCGAEIHGGRYCSNCGKPLESTDIYGMQIEPSHPAPVTYDGNVRKVHKLAYALLALFLGSFGIHRFYAGRTFSGVMYLIFFWTYVPALLGLIECICALVRDPDANGYLRVDPNRYFV